VDAGYVRVVTTDLTKIEIAKKHAANDFEVMRSVTRKRVRDLTKGLSRPLENSPR
jgi:hypothetical protein